MAKLFLTLFSVLQLCTSVYSQSIFDYNAVTIVGDTVPMSQYLGKKLMIVNTASYCGYTPQFTQLQQLYQQYHVSNNFEILGFPCNDFGNQDPGTDSASLNFCSSNYNVTFQMMSHVNIVSDTTDVFKWLQQQSLNGVSNAQITWNFHKFLIDETGHWVAYYPSQTLPNAPAIVNWITSPNITSNKEITKSAVTFAYSLASNQFTISNNSSQPFRVKLFSLDSKLIEDISNNSSQLNYDTSNLPNGVYFACVQNSLEKKTYKFIVSK